MPKSFLFLLFLFLVNITAAYCQTKTKTLGILNFASSDRMTVDAAVLTSRLYTELYQLGRFRIVEMNRVQEILREMGIEQACGSAECAVKVGNFLGVELMLAGNIGYMGETFSIDVRVIDVNTRKVDYTESESYQGKADGLFDIMRTIAFKISNHYNTSSLGTIGIFSKPANALVFIDDREVGKAPQIINNLLPGNYIIKGKLPRYDDCSIKAKISKGRIEQVELEMIPHRGRPWPKILIGGIVSGIVVYYYYPKKGTLHIKIPQNP